jgi:crotonobetainyl-CoA:carnitine CoA-transferase CaiB-like acyl-CoA transferase
MTATPWPADSLSGLRVLDLSSNIAGPLCAMVLSDLGADVVKVERPDGGDDARSLFPSWHGDSTVFLSVNRGKRSIELDLRSPAGRDALLRLADDADVLIESFGPGIAAKLGVDFDAVAARNSRIIYGTVSAFGAGPIGAQLPGYDSLIQAFSGMMSITGHPDTPPTRVAPSAVDISTGLWLTIATFVALRERERESEPRPRHLEGALVDSAFNLMNHQVLTTLGTGQAPGPLGSGSPATMPNGAFQAADGWVMVVCGNQVQWERLCEALRAPELAGNPQYRTVADRIANRAALQAELDAHLVADTVDNWIARLGAARVPIGRLNDLSEALAHPLVAERGLLIAPSGGDGQPLAQLRLPIDPDGAGVGRAPPRLGEHTAEVLRQAGFRQDEIDVVSGADGPAGVDRT